MIFSHPVGAAGELRDMKSMNKQCGVFEG